MATYIHKKYFAVPYDANALTKMHVRQSNARNFGPGEGTAKGIPAGSWQNFERDTFLLFFALPVFLIGAVIATLVYFNS